MVERFYRYKGRLRKTLKKKERKKTWTKEFVQLAIQVVQKFLQPHLSCRIMKVGHININIKHSSSKQARLKPVHSREQ